MGARCRARLSQPKSKHPWTISSSMRCDACRELEGAVVAAAAEAAEVAAVAFLTEVAAAAVPSAWAMDAW